MDGLSSFLKVEGGRVKKVFPAEEKVAGRRGEKLQDGRLKRGAAGALCCRGGPRRKHAAT